MKKILIFCLIITTMLISGCSALTGEEKTTDILDYSKYFGNEGKHINDIFPKSIPDSAEIEDFHYGFGGMIDESVVSYLVYTCNDEDFMNETERLANLNFSEEVFVYGGSVHGRQPKKSHFQVMV